MAFRSMFKVAVLFACGSMALTLDPIAFKAFSFDDDDDDRYLNRTSSSSLIGYKSSAPKANDFNETFPILFITLTSIGIFLNLVCVFQTLIARKYQQNIQYTILLAYFALKAIYSVFLCLMLLSRNWLSDSKYYIKPTKAFCKILHFWIFYGEMLEVLLLIVIWLIILSERNMVGFQSYLSTSTNSPTNQQQTQPGAVNKPSNKKLYFWLFIVCCINFFGCGILSLSSNVYEARSYISGKMQTYCYFKDGSALMILVFITMAFLPVTYALFLFSTLFWALFGGQRDPIADKLTQTEQNFLKFFKILSLLKGIELFFLDGKSIQAFKLSYSVLEVLRLMGLIIIILTAILYIYYERMIQTIGQNMRDNRPITTSRVNLFRHNSQSNEINYSKLNENGQ